MSTQREIKRARTGDGKGVQPVLSFTRFNVPPLAEDEFMYYSQLGMSAAEFKLTITNPLEYDLSLLDDADGEGDYNTNNPYQRMAAALQEHLSEEEQKEKMPAIMTRFIGIIDLYAEGKLRPWVNHNAAEPDYVLIKEAVFRAAARAPIDSHLQFEWTEFKRIVEEILLLETDA
jgi:hypothetical protein